MADAGESSIVREKSKIHLSAQSSPLGQLWDSSDSHRPHLGCRREKETLWRHPVHHAMINQGKIIKQGKRSFPAVAKPSQQRLPVLSCVLPEEKKQQGWG